MIYYLQYYSINYISKYYTNILKTKKIHFLITNYLQIIILYKNTKIKSKKLLYKNNGNR